jgi:hypothetical protein
MTTKTYLIRIFRVIRPEFWRHPVKCTDESSALVCSLLKDTSNSEVAKLKASLFVNKYVGS